MKYLVSGATGFIGSKFCEKLKEDKHEVFKLGRNALSPTIPTYVDYIVNLAGLTIRKHDVRDSEEFLYSNVLFTHDILEVARKQTNLKKFIHVSTGEVYGPILSGKLHNERDPLNPVNAYTESKAAADMLCLGRAEAFRLPLVIVRPCDVYGAGMASNSFMPVVANNILEGKPVCVFGDGTQKRQWLHVDDCVEAIRFLLAVGKPREIYNVPGKERVPNQDVIYLIEEVLGKRGTHELFPYPAERGPDYEWGIDGAKIQALGWYPMVSLREGLKDFVPKMVIA